MQSIFPTNPDSVRTRSTQLRSGIVAAVVHATVLLCAVGVLHRSSRVAPYRLPGTAKGTETLVYFSPGSPASSTGQVAVKKPAPHDPQPSKLAAIAAPKPVEAQAPTAEAGSGDSALSGIGDGNISIALQKHFPYPTPDLSTLPHGTRGDVILNAVIDEHGQISDLTLLKGLGPAIDDAVIATVRQWSYTPATKNGMPVPSEQELHFHYERS